MPPEGFGVSAPMTRLFSVRDPYQRGGERADYSGRIGSVPGLPDLRVPEWKTGDQMAASPGDRRPQHAVRSGLKNKPGSVPVYLLIILFNNDMEVDDETVS
jgi:hypothetical protein